MKRFYRIVSAILCMALLIPSLATTAFAASLDVIKAAPGALEELSELSSYLHASASTQDNTSKLLVNIYTYYDENKTYTPATIGEGGSVSILYVMNTNTERLGKKSDTELIQSFLDRGYFVLVLDYQNNPEACGTALDWSVQDIRCQVIGGSPFKGGKAYTSGTYTDGKLAGTDSICAQSYILPAGYDIAYNIPYFSYDKHGVAGSFEYIVEIWNNDFKSVKRNTIVKWVDENGLPNLELTDAITEKAPNDTTNIDYATWFKTADGKNGISQAKLATLSTSEQKQYQYTYIGNTIVREVTDCVQPDGTMIDLTLYMDILYPSDYEGELPVMITMSSSYTRASSWTSETRPYLNGPLFNGYVGVVSDYGLVPMCRNDHYGYFCGDSQLNSISGDNGTYSLSYYNGIHSDTALLRTIRKIGVDGLYIEGYGEVNAPINPEKIGAYGNSKAGVIIRLANPTPEKLTELRNYEGHNSETRLEAYEGNYPYVDPYISNGATTDERIAMPEEQPILTYDNGQTIHSGLNFVFANCGGASNTITEGSAPIFGVGTQSGKNEGSYYTYYATTANLARNLDIPFFGLVAPTIAHDLGYGLDKDYGVDIYGAFNLYANYWLKDDSAECIIVDVDTTKDICVASDVPIDNVYEINEESSIKLQFTGSISASEIQKVKIYNLSTGGELTGDWHGSYGNQQWQFIPYDIKDATYYTIVVPDDIVAENGKNLKETVTHTFRTTNGVTYDAVSVTSASGDLTLNDDEPIFFTFEDKDYSTAHDVTLRFAVTNDAVNTVGIYAVSGGQLGAKLGEVIVAGYGVYNFDVTDYIKNCAGAPAVAVKIEETVGTNVLHDYDYESGASSGIYINATIAKSEITDAIPNADGTPNMSGKLDYSVRSAYYIDLDGNLVSKYTNSLFNFASSSGGFKNGVFDEVDYGRRFRVTFRVYDETSRVVSIYNGNGYNADFTIADFENTNYSFYTKAGEWTTVTVEFTVDDEMYFGEALRKQVLLLDAESKSIAVLDEDAVVNVRSFASATSKPGNCAGKPGLNNSYVQYNTVEEMVAAGKVTFYDEFSYGLYIDDVVFEEVTTRVDLASTAPMLSITPTTSEDILPTVSASVLSTEPNSAQDGLWISGGKDGFDTSSVKTYVKLSLDKYFDGYAAFLFNAYGAGSANVSVYGVADVVAGESWTSETITSATAPANDIYGSGVNVNAVYGNAPLATFATDGGEKTCLVELTEFASYMHEKGAKEITLVIVSDANTVTNIEVLASVDTSKIIDYACNSSSTAPEFGGSGYSNLNLTYTYAGYNASFDAFTIDLRAYAASGVNSNQNIRIGIFNEIWKNSSYVGKTIRFSFKAKASVDGSLKLSLNQLGSYVWASGSFPGFSAVADLTDEWKTYTYEFVVTQEMYDGMANGTIQGNGLALGVRFNDPNYLSADGTAYKDVQINLRGFVVSEVVGNDGSAPISNVYDFSGSNSPDVQYRGYNIGALWAITNGALEIDTGNISHQGNTGQNFNVFVFNNVLKNNTQNIGKTFRVIIKAKSSIPGKVDLSLNSSGGSAGVYATYPGHNWSIELTEEYQTFSFSFVALEGMFDSEKYGDAGLGLGIRLYNGFNGGTQYKDATISFDEISVVEDAYIRSVDVEYDFSTKSPTTVNFAGYSTQIGSIKDGAIVITPAISTNCNSGQFARVTALEKVWENPANSGKTFTVTFRAKATEPGVMDFALNQGAGGFTIYSYGGKTYSQQYSLTTEYQTFTYTFKAIDDMFTNSLAPLACAFRFYNGFKGSNGSYKDVTISIDDIRVYEEMSVDNTTLDFTDSVAVSGSGNSGTLTVYADNSVNGLPTIMKTYLSYDLSGVTTSYGATLGVNLAGANGETVRVYLLSDTVLSTPLTYANAPVPVGAAAGSFVAVNGMNYVDLSNAIAENAGKNIVLVLAIEEPSGNVQILSEPELKVIYEYHNYTSDSQKHSAKAPTQNSLGNVEFYTCEGCDKLYVKDGDKFVEVGIDDVIIPMLDKCTEHNYVDGVCTICGDHNCTGGTATCTNKAVCTVCGREYGELDSAAHAWDNGSVTLAPTCEEQGTKTFTCQHNANHTYTEALSALGHTEKALDAKDATCTENGYTAGVMCSTCDKVLVPQTILPANGHTDGDKNFVCDVCSEELCTEHQEQTVSGKAPTCTEAGLTDGKKCSICGDILVPQTEIPALGHSYDAEVIAPDCTSGGYTLYTCSLCGNSYVSDETAPLGHTEEILEGRAPTCTEPGLTTGIKCSVCGEILATQADIIPDGHKYEATETAPDCENAGYTTHACTVCGDSYVDGQTPPLGHDWMDATTEAPKSCKVCGKTDGDKLPENETDPDHGVITEKDHSECEPAGAFNKLITAIVNFFRKLFGLPAQCYCGEKLE